MHRNERRKNKNRATIQQKNHGRQQINLKMKYLKQTIKNKLHLLFLYMYIFFSNSLKCHTVLERWL